MNFFSRLSDHTKGVILTLFGVVFITLGIIGVRYMVITYEVSIYDILFWGCLGAVLYSLPIFYWKNLSFSKIATTCTEYKKTLFITVLLSAISILIFLYLIQNTFTDTITLFDQSATLWSMVLGIMFLNERISGLQILGTIICINGIYIMYNSSFSITPFTFLLMSINPLLYALQSFILKRYGKGIDSFLYSFIRLFGICILVGVMFVIFQKISIPPLPVIIALGVFQFVGMIVGKICTTKAHEYLSISTLNLLFILMPILALLATPLIEINYVFELWKYIGAGIVLLGMTIFLWKKGE